MSLVLLSLTLVVGILADWLLSRVLPFVVPPVRHLMVITVFVLLYACMIPFWLGLLRSRRGERDRHRRVP